ncbi:MAG: serine hydrolase domain-containing protein [Candidatus Zixiibacteriota bacterium]
MKKSLSAVLLFSFLILFAGTSIVWGENKPLAENPEVAAAIAVFDAWAQQAVTDREQPGVSFGLVYDQDLIWAKGYGFADLAKKIPATPSTAYRIASLTKLFTATAILQLRDAGKLQLDDPVVKYVPWFQLKDTCADSPVITIRHLLTHTSGIPRELDGLYWDDMKFPEQKEFVSMLQQSTTILPREKEFKYSNVAYSVLGYVIAKVSGESYPDYIKTHILTPLGMTGTEVLPHKDMPTLATGYKFHKPGQTREVEPFLDVKAMVSAGNMASTVEDLAKFISLQFRDGPARGAQILKGSTLREMQRVQWLDPDWKSGRGLGWGVSRVDDQVRIGHTGSVPGHMTNISAAPADKFGVIVLTNSDDGKPGSYAAKAWAIVAPAVKKATAEAEKPLAADSAWTKFTGEYVWSDSSISKVMLLAGELCIVDPTSDSPWEGRTRLEPVSPGIFRMKDQDQKGELVRFELDSSGKVVRMVEPGYSAFPR